ncbi:MAG: nuclear transport factor 2 family protein [candidate division Zixibacteria bacterium]|nr:nuclear transport factor 2 family protein [candidate division Zixibacteria bacterium]
MRHPYLILMSIVLLVFMGALTAEAGGTVADRQAVSDAVHASIGWALEKDTTLLYSVMAHDSELFYFGPNDAGNISGFAEFRQLVEGFFMLDDFKATSYEIRDLKINFSSGGEVAWFSCRLDDYGEWKGQPTAWDDCRWSGVLEKRDGHWVLVQMHFSFDTAAVAKKQAERDKEKYEGKP